MSKGLPAILAKFILLVFSNWALTSGAAPLATDDEFDQMWKETHVDFSLLNYYADRVYPCRQDAEHLLACVQMVNVLGSRSKPKQVLLPTGAAAAYPEFEMKPVGRLGEFEVMQIERELNPESSTKPFDLAKFKATYQNRFESTREAARRTFQTTPSIDFLHLARTFYDQLPADEIKPKVLVGAINALITSFDSHGGLFLRAEDIRRQTQPAERVVGIGAEVRLVRDGVYLNEVYPQSGGAEAGLKSGDVITGINGRATQNQTLDALVKQMRGEPNTEITLKILNPEREVRVTRRLFEVSKVPPPRYVDHLGVKIGVLKIFDFMGLDTADRFGYFLSHLDPDTRALILDLRGDPGGSVDEAVSVAGHLLGNKRPIVIERGIENGKPNGRDIVRVSAVEQASDLPLVVLVDQRSASASEIVAGAVQDYRRGFLLGTRTYGKGSMQVVSVFAPSLKAPIDVWLLALRAELDEHRTIARFYQPGGHTNQGLGLQPDFEIFSKPNPTEDERTFFTESDENPGALPPVGDRWVQPRPEVIENLKSKCLAQHRAQAVYDRSLYPEGADYQLLSAEELLGCLVQP